MADMKKTAAVAAILAVGMVVSAALLSRLFIRVNHEQEITVKGYAEKSVLSDRGKFYCACAARKMTMKGAYEELAKSRGLVLKYLKENGFDPGEIEVFNIDIQPIYRRNEKGNRTNEIEFYRASQNIGILSGKVDLVRKMSRKITELIREGIDISSTAPEFFVSNLDQIKLELIAKATEDGSRRARVLARESGGKVGALASARQGVFQITSPNSTATSGYGIYDTSTIKKTVKAVVTLRYAIE